MIKKSIFARGDHDDDMRLRILVKNGCNLRCSYCLNDFQEKGNDTVSIVRVHFAIKEYSRYCNENELKPIVTFSGGEPGLWKFLPEACKISKESGCETKVCTNGKALEHHIPNVDRWHVHIFGPKFTLPHWCTPENTVLQYVATGNTEIEKVFDIIEARGMYPLKFFVDFNSPNIQKISKKLEQICAGYDNVYARYTGVQPNRGTACTGCKRKCITLKGIWLFPSGDMSTCPQRQPQAVKLSRYDVIDQDYFYLCHAGHTSI